jgi:hypothetical protein
MKPADIFLGEVYSDGQDERLAAAESTDGQQVTWFPWKGAICGPPHTCRRAEFAAWAVARLCLSRAARVK